MVGIEAFDTVAVGRAKVLEPAVFEGMVNVKALVVRAGVSVPMVFVDVWCGVHVAGLMALRFRLRAWIVSFRRRWWNVTLVSSGIIGPTLLSMLLAALRENRKRRHQCQCNRKNESSFHFVSSIKLKRAPNTTRVDGNWVGLGPANATHRDCHTGTARKSTKGEVTVSPWTSRAKRLSFGRNCLSLRNRV